METLTWCDKILIYFILIDISWRLWNSLILMSMPVRQRYFMNILTNIYFYKRYMLIMPVCWLKANVCKPRILTRNGGDITLTRLKKLIYFIIIAYYIFHHFFFKPTSSSTKLRVVSVFNVLAKTSSGISLNDILAVGPTVQIDQNPILLRSRVCPIAFIVDISKRYRQILVDPDDLNQQGIFRWSSSHEPIKEYMLITVTYAISPPSSLASHTLFCIVEGEGSKYPLVSNVVLKQFMLIIVL